MVLNPTVIHWLQMIVIMHWLWQCSGGAHVIRLIFQEHHSGSQSVGMNYRSDGNRGVSQRRLQRAWGDLCNIRDAGVVPVCRRGLVRPRAGCSTPLLYCGLRRCLLELRSRVLCSVRRGAYSQSPEFTVQCCPGHLKQPCPSFLWHHASFVF